MKIKAERVWFGGARETREPRVKIGLLLLVRDILSIFPLFKMLIVSKDQDFFTIFENFLVQ